MNVTTQRPKTTATGVSGTTYTFTVYDLDQTYNAVGGVYIALNGRNAVYVGQTGDLSQRFDAHHKWRCMLLRGAKSMAVMEVSRESDRLRIERDLILALRPPCNEQ